MHTESKELVKYLPLTPLPKLKAEKPDEYVMLSAHFDSWDGGTGATDNGTGTLTMMEAMRMLKNFTLILNVPYWLAIGVARKKG
jgi:carboxypeptidase Q